MWDPSSLISNRTHALCFGSSESSKVFKVHWTFREVPTHTSRYPLLLLLIRNWSEVKLLSRVRLFATPSTVAYQASLSMGFPRQKWGIVCPQMPILLRSGHHAIGNLAGILPRRSLISPSWGCFSFQDGQCFQRKCRSRRGLRAIFTLCQKHEKEQNLIQIPLNRYLFQCLAL